MKKEGRWHLTPTNTHTDTRRKRGRNEWSPSPFPVRVKAPLQQMRVQRVSLPLLSRFLRSPSCSYAIAGVTAAEEEIGDSA